MISVSLWLWISLAFLPAVWTVEEYPGGEVIAEFFEPMLHSGGHEEDIAGAEVTSSISSLRKFRFRWR